MSNLVLEVKTIQVSPFKTLIESLKDILADVNIEFNEEGMKIITMDSTQTILVHLKLESSNFEYYYCKNKIFVGVNMNNLFKIIKTLTINDSLTFFMEEADENTLGISIVNGDKNRKTTIKFKLIDLDIVNFKAPSTKFESILTMPSDEFNKICRDMSALTDVIEIKSVGNQLILGGVGDFADQETVLGQYENGLTFKLAGNKDNVIQGYYNLKHLQLFAKCTSLCTSIELYMKNNYPLVIKFAVGSLGNLTLALAPKLEIN
jgi:proliferating cell nuclear antigen